MKLYIGTIVDDEGDVRVTRAFSGKEDALEALMGEMHEIIHEDDPHTITLEQDRAFDAAFDEGDYDVALAFAWQLLPFYNLSYIGIVEVDVGESS